LGAAAAGIHPRCTSSEPAAGTVFRSGFRIGGVSVAITGCCRDDVTLVPSLVPFRAETGSPDVTLKVEWARDLPPLLGRQLFDSGCTWRLYEGDSGFRFDFHIASFGEQPYKRLFMDRQFSRATLQMNEESFADSGRRLSPLEYPLDELLIMHRLTQEKAIELHGCGIVRADGAGNLFVGHSGAGKSTTTQLWTEREQVEVLSDDRIIVRSEMRGRHEGMRMFGTPWHGEAAYASPGSAPLERIFVLEHGRGNTVTRLSPGQAVAELFARSFVPFHRHEYVESALEFLEEVVAAVPCYRYAFEPNRGAVERIREFRD
jgi:hypothetical protein